MSIRDTDTLCPKCESAMGVNPRHGFSWRTIGCDLDEIDEKFTTGEFASVVGERLMEPTT